jgi:YD repeat-containing protein
LLPATIRKKTEQEPIKAVTDTIPVKIINSDLLPVETAITSSIVGKWKPIEIFMEDLEEKEKKVILDKATVEFTRDGKYLSKSEEDHETGTYSYDEKTKMVTTIAPDGQIEKIKVEISNDKLKVTTKEGTMHFKRLMQ